jgi:hypothetical protein
MFLKKDNNKEQKTKFGRFFVIFTALLYDVPESLNHAAVPMLIADRKCSIRRGRLKVGLHQEDRRSH